MQRTISNAFVNADDSDEEERDKVPVNAKMPRFAKPIEQHSGIMATKMKHPERSYYWLQQHKSIRPTEEFSSGSSQILGSTKTSAASSCLKPQFSSAPKSQEQLEEKKRVEEMIQSRIEDEALEHFMLERRKVGGPIICHLCKRKFVTWEKLEGHEKFSDLHKQNMAKSQQAQEKRKEELTSPRQRKSELNSIQVSPVYKQKEDNRVEHGERRLQSCHAEQAIFEKTREPQVMRAGANGEEPRSRSRDRTVKGTDTRERSREKKRERSRERGERSSERRSKERRRETREHESDDHGDQEQVKPRKRRFSEKFV